MSPVIMTDLNIELGSKLHGQTRIHNFKCYNRIINNISYSIRNVNQKPTLLGYTQKNLVFENWISKI